LLQSNAPAQFGKTGSSQRNTSQHLTCRIDECPPRKPANKRRSCATVVYLLNVEASLVPNTAWKPGRLQSW